MSEELTPEEEKVIDELFDAVASELGEGKSKEKIVKELVKQNWPEDSANQIVDSTQQAMNDYKDSREGRNVLAGQYARRMIYGILWAVGGTVVTVGTYRAASGGGTYVVAWGAILFGTIAFSRGLFGWLKYRSYNTKNRLVSELVTEGYEKLLPVDDYLHVTCWLCEKRLKVPVKFEGKKVRCTSCKGVIDLAVNDKK